MLSRRSRIYWRGGKERRKDGTVVNRVKRAWGDFRDFADVGGGREPLIPEGGKVATDDPAIAEGLVTARLIELKRLRKDRVLIGESREGATLAAVARDHLIRKAESGKNPRWLSCVELHLKRAVEFFGGTRRLTTIGVADVQRWSARLEQTDNGRDGKMSGGTVRHHLNSLSNLFLRAQSLTLVPPGYNPVASIMPGEKPAGDEVEAQWLEIHDASWLLEMARRLQVPVNGAPFLYQLVATMLLTGARKSEATGLEVDDISFDRQTATIRPNQWRGLKNRGSARVVPLHPQLAEILQPYMVPLDRPPRSGLLFPWKGEDGVVRPLSNFDKSLDYLGTRAGWEVGEIRSRLFRNTWAAARLQTLDHDRPIALWTVQKEGGWADDAMLQRIYGHLGTVRHRAAVVEFRWGQHRNRLKDRMAKCGDNAFVTTAD